MNSHDRLKIYEILEKIDPRLAATYLHDSTDQTFKVLLHLRNISKMNNEVG